MSLTWTIALLLLANTAADKPPLASAAHVRAAQSAGKILEDAESRSATIRGLVDRLGTSDVIVYVEITSSPQIPVARTKLVTATSAVRFLRIGINTSVTPFDVAPLLGHELQHALEIAEHAEVTDDAGMRRLFERIGHPSGLDSYETDAARDIERQVRAETLRARRD